MSNSLDTLLDEDTYRVPERLPVSELPANNLPDLGNTPLFWPDFQSQEYWRAGSATADYSSGKDRNCSKYEVLKNAQKRSGTLRILLLKKQKNVDFPISGVLKIVFSF